METMNLAFEKWIKSLELDDWYLSKYSVIDHPAYKDNVQYKDDGTQFAWESWQAAHERIKNLLE